jgi:hypothetical protein
MYLQMDEYSKIWLCGTMLRVKKPLTGLPETRLIGYAGQQSRQSVASSLLTAKRYAVKAKAAARDT